MEVRKTSCPLTWGPGPETGEATGNANSPSGAAGEPRLRQPCCETAGGRKDQDQAHVLSFSFTRAVILSKNIFQACLTPPTPTQAPAALNLPRIVQKLWTPRPAQYQLFPNPPRHDFSFLTDPMETMLPSPVSPPPTNSQGYGLKGSIDMNVMSMKQVHQ